MKKIVKLSIIVMLVIMMGCTVYAATLECDISMDTSKTECSKDEEFTVSVNLTNIKSEKGVTAVEGVLEFDKNVLTLVQTEGKNGWSAPTNGTSYNESTGKFVVDGLATADQTIMQFTFKVNADSTQNTTITLKDITVADGVAPVKTISSVSKNVAIKGTTQTDTNTTNTNQTANTNTNNTTTTSIVSTNTTTNTNSNTSTNTNSNKNTNNTTSANLIKANTAVNTDSNLPKAGNSSMIRVFLTVAVVGAIYSYMMILKVNKKIHVKLDRH